MNFFSEAVLPFNRARLPFSSFFFFFFLYFRDVVPAAKALHSIHIPFLRPLPPLLFRF